MLQTPFRGFLGTSAGRRTFLGLQALALALALLLSSCGGGDDRTKAKLRFVNASVYPSLDLRMEGNLRFGGVGYGAGAAYQEIDPDETDSRVSVAGSTTALVSLTPTLVRKKHYSLLAWGREGELKTVLLNDDQTAADAGKARLQILQASTDAGALDVYLTADADALTGAVPVLSGAAAGTLSALTVVDAGSWRLRVTGAGDREDLRLDVRGLSLPSTSVQTLLLTPSSGGVLVQALLLTQQGAVSARAVEHARVRVAGALPSGGAVGVTLGGLSLLSETASPVVGRYQWVPAGEQALVVRAAGSVLPSSTVSLTPGSEATLLVHAAGAAPALSWLADDNRLPVASSAAKLRLVNGLAASSDALSLTASALPVASAVLPGTSSTASALTAASVSELSVRAAGAAQPLYVNDEPALKAAGVYTVFVLGGPVPLGLLRVDR